MKTYKTLIKLAKQETDKLRRIMADMDNQVVQLDALSDRLDEQLQYEMDNAVKHPEMGGFFGNFSKHIQVRKEKLAKEKATLLAEMDKLRDAIAERFAEQKKYEIILERKIEVQKKKVEKREGEMLDEVAQQLYERGKREER